jgi:deazaflavin-dependent oxidoreductase (nitroreductase family)
VPNIRWLIALITKFHRFVYLRSGGHIGARALHLRFLLVIHTGRKTGLERITPLLYVEDDGRWMVVATNGGDDRPPCWWLNLKGRAEATVQVGSESVVVKAREATDAEADRLWPRFDTSYPYYKNYRQRTSRQIPIVIFERVC